MDSRIMRSVLSTTALFDTSTIAVTSRSVAESDTSLLRITESCLSVFIIRAFVANASASLSSAAELASNGADSVL